MGHVFNVRASHLVTPGAPLPYFEHHLPQAATTGWQTAADVYRMSQDTRPPDKDAGEYLVTQAPIRPTTDADNDDTLDVLSVARRQVLERGEGLTGDQVLQVLQLPDDRLDELLALAHEVRMRWCGPEVEVEGIISLKTGGCPEDCHFCSQSGRFETPVRSVRLDIPMLVEAARETAATGATEFCIVAAVRGPEERLMEQVRAGVAAVQAEVEINVACSLGILTREQAVELSDLGVHRYNHNLETA